MPYKQRVGGGTWILVLFPYILILIDDAPDAKQLEFDNLRKFERAFYNS